MERIFDYKFNLDDEMSYQKRNVLLGYASIKINSNYIQGQINDCFRENKSKAFRNQVWNDIIHLPYYVLFYTLRESFVNY